MEGHIISIYILSTKKHAEKMVLKIINYPFQIKLIFFPQRNTSPGYKAAESLALKFSNSEFDSINHFTSRPKCMPGSCDPGITILNPMGISVMYGYVT